jgi:hypothetical protein
LGNSFNNPIRPAAQDFFSQPKSTSLDRPLPPSRRRQCGGFDVSVVASLLWRVGDNNNVNPKAALES